MATPAQDLRRKNAIFIVKGALRKALESGELADMESALEVMNSQSASVPFDWQLALVSTIQQARKLQDESAA